MTVVFDGDVVVAGAFRAGNMAVPNNSVGSGQIDPNSPIVASKLYHRHALMYNTDRGTAVTAKRRIAHIAKAAGAIVDLKITLGVACTGTTSYVKVDVKKNGSNVTSTPAEHNPTDAAYATGDLGAFSALPYAAGDKLEFDVTVNAGDGAVGEELCAVLTVDEAPA